MCQHQPPCPAAADSDRDAARVVSAHPEQGWSLLCNGVVLFDDSGQILPSGRVLRPGQWDSRPCRGETAERADLSLPLAS